MQFNGSDTDKKELVSKSVASNDQQKKNKIPHFFNEIYIKDIVKANDSEV
jgi:hypothetical protein